MMTDVVLVHGSSCTVASGRLLDPYSGTLVDYRVSEPDSVEVDHALPLLTAWALCAAHWPQQQRIAFANDSSIELVPVARASNLPAAGKCRYDARFVAVLAKYQLPVIAADKTAVTSVLRSCS